LHEKFKISEEVQGNKLVITFKGKKEAVEKLDEKIDAMHILMEDCCCGGDEEGCCQVCFL